MDQNVFEIKDLKNQKQVQANSHIIEVSQSLKQQHQDNEKDRSSESDQDRYYRDNDQKFDLSSLKPFDLKAQWLGNTQDLIKKFQEKQTQVQNQKKSLKKAFQLFDQNQAKYRKNSLRKIHFEFDKKKIYEEFMQKSRRLIQKLSPGLLLNIGSYVDRNIFFYLASMRRISKVFNFIYKNQEVVQFLSDKDLGSIQNRKTMQKICYDWLCFQRAFLYYKDIKYTDEVPPNSFKTDLQNAVNFINDIHKRVFKKENFEIGYFQWVNNFMKTHRVVIALSTLSLTNLIMIRKPSIVAFSNYLALNPSQRKKQQITKTRYLQVIKIVQDQNYHDCLIINTKVSIFLEEEYNYDFSVFILHSLTGKVQPKGSFLDELFTYNVLMFHKHNDLKNVFVQNVELKEGSVLDTDKGICVRFNQKNIEEITLSITTQNDFKTVDLKGSFTNCLIRDYQKNLKFSQSYVYNEQYHYIILIKNFMQYEPTVTETNQQSS